MNAFNHDPELKHRFVAQLALSRKERKALVEPKALPLSINEMSAQDYEQLLGIPRALVALLEDYDTHTTQLDPSVLMATFFDAVEPGRDLRDMVPRFVKILLSAADTVMTHAQPHIVELLQQVIIGHETGIPAKEWRILRLTLKTVREAESDLMQHELASLLECLAWDAATTQTLGADAQVFDINVRQRFALKAIDYADTDVVYHVDLLDRHRQQLKAASDEQKSSIGKQFFAQEAQLNPIMYQRFCDIREIKIGQLHLQRRIHRDWLLSLI